MLDYFGFASCVGLIIASCLLAAALFSVSTSRLRALVLLGGRFFSRRRFGLSPSDIID